VIRKLKILMIAPQFRPLAGGYERAAERLSIALADRGHTVQIVTERREQAWPKCEPIGKANLRRLWCVYKPRVHKLTTLFSLASYLLLNGWRYQVWHVHQYGDDAGLAIAMSKLLRRPVVLKITSSGSNGLAARNAQSRLPRFMKYFHQRVAAIAALTNETRDEAIAYGIPAERVHVVGNGIEIHRFQPQSDSGRELLKKQIGLPGRKIALFVGRFYEAKNTLGLVEAWSLALPKLDASWDLVLLGGGPQQDAIVEFCRQHNIQSRVHLPGHQTNVDQWLGASDLFVLSSWYEGLSNALLEAMACGLPTVSTRVSGIPELIEETNAGIGVPVGDMPAFAEAIVELAGDDERRKKAGAAAREIACRKYSLESVTSAYEALYESLVQPNLAKTKLA
jgi:glycosyltransferase involved in cell wall biosynthesis